MTISCPINDTSGVCGFYRVNSLKSNLQWKGRVRDLVFSYNTWGREKI